MDDTGITLAELFHFGRDEYAFLDRALSGVKDRLRNQSAIPQKLIYRTIEKAFRKSLIEKLSINAMDLIADSWAKYGLFAGLVSEGPAGERTFVPLAEHTVGVELFPSTEILFDGVKIATILLEVIAKLELSGVVLQIDNGQISDLAGGCCRGSCDVKIIGVTVLSSEIGPIDMPGKFEPSRGFPLRPVLNVVGDIKTP